MPRVRGRRNLQVRAIRSRFDAGDVTVAELAREFSVRRSCIRNIVARKTWTRVA